MLNVNANIIGAGSRAWTPASESGLQLWLDGERVSTLTKQGAISVTSIVVSGGTATVTCAAAHGGASGHKFTIAGATLDADLNGLKTATVTSTTEFTYSTTAGNGTDNGAGITATPEKPRVSAWADRSANANNATQGTLLDQPRFNATTGGLIFVNEDHMDLGSGFAASTFTIYIVYKVDAFDNVSYLFAGNGQGIYAGGAVGGLNGFGIFDGTNIREANTEPTALGVSVFQKANLYRNGSETGYDNTDTISSLTLSRIAKRVDVGAGLHLDGEINAVLAYNVAHDAATRGKIEAYLANRHGFSLS